MRPDAPPRPPARALTGTARDLSWLYSPAPLRGVLAALLDIEREVGASLRPGLEHSVAHVRLAWWRDECERCAAARPAHPATQALLAAAGRPVDPRGLVDAATWDLAAATFATRAELAGYCARWASAMTGIAAQSIAGSDAEREALARSGLAIGAALRELELLLALAAEARAGRLRLPLDELEQAGIEPEALARQPWPAALPRLIASSHRAARTALAAGVAALSPQHRPALRGLLVWATLTHRASRRAERSLYRPPRPRTDPSTRDRAGHAADAGRAALRSRLADAWLAWRAARLADRGMFRLEMENDND